MIQSTAGGRGRRLGDATLNRRCRSADRFGTSCSHAIDVGLRTRRQTPGSGGTVRWDGSTSRLMCCNVSMSCDLRPIGHRLRGGLIGDLQ